MSRFAGNDVGPAPIDGKWLFDGAAERHAGCSLVCFRFIDPALPRFLKTVPKVN